MRYIDADALIKKIYPMGIGDGKYTINAKAVKLAIDNAPTADVVPKSEVEELTRENESLAKTVNEASELVRKLRSKVKKSKSEVEELEAECERQYEQAKADILANMADGGTSCHWCIDEHKAQAKAEVAREIFEGIEELAKIYTFPVVKNGVVEIAKEPFWCIEPNDLAELKKKYTENME